MFLVERSARTHHPGRTLTVEHSEPSPTPTLYSQLVKTTLIIVLTRLHLRLLRRVDDIFLIISSLLSSPLLRALASLATFLGGALVRSHATALVLALVGGSFAAFLPAVESACHLSELGDAVGDGFRSTVWEWGEQLVTVCGALQSFVVLSGAYGWQM
jgi:hypothetical protein